jgi:arginine decarboxylase
MPENHAEPDRAGGSALLDITVRTGTGSGRTLLSAFDHALLDAGVANFNLVTLSSVIPPHGRVRLDRTRLAGGHGDRLYCVLSQAHADHPGEIAWAGLGWTTDATGGGLFVEHHGGSEESVLEQIELSLADMSANRGGGYGPVHSALASAHCVAEPVCALVVAAYTVSTWDAHE